MVHLPEMLPSAQTACSATFECMTNSNLMSGPMAPALTTDLVWSEVPEVMLVNAQVASNCNSGLTICNTTVIILQLNNQFIACN